MTEELSNYFQIVIKCFTQNIITSDNGHIQNLCKISEGALKEAIAEIERLEKVVDQYNSITGIKLNPETNDNGCVKPETLELFDMQYPSSQFPELAENLRPKKQ